MASGAKEQGRRTGNVRTGGRAARVVEQAMGATLQELAQVGYAALRVEDVAARCGVNKTTLYRRWPSKGQLVAAALGSALRERSAIDTGSVRGDLRASLLMVLEMDAHARGLTRVVLAERTEPEVDAITRELRDEMRRSRVAMVKRGIARGELPRGTDPGLVVELLSAPLQGALLFDETFSRRKLDRMLDLVLAGAAASAAGTTGTQRRKKASKR